MLTGTAGDNFPSHPGLEILFATHRFRPRCECFLMYQLPRSLMAFRMQCPTIVWIVVLGQSPSKIIGLAYVRSSVGIEQYVHEIHVQEAGRVKKWLRR